MSAIRILGFDQLPQISALTIDKAHCQSLMSAPDVCVPILLTFDERDYGTSTRPPGRGMQSSKTESTADRIRAARQHRQVRAGRRVLRPQGPDAEQHRQRLFNDARNGIAFWFARPASITASRLNHAMVTVKRSELQPVCTTSRRSSFTSYGACSANECRSLFSTTRTSTTRLRFVPTFDLVADPDDRTLLLGPGVPG